MKIKFILLSSRHLSSNQKWEEFASTYEIGGSGASVADHTPKEVTRTIKPHHYLRPIPQGQLDALNMTPEEILNYQNDGYRPTE